VLGVYALAWGLGLPIELGSAAAGAFCVTELISIVENASAIGVPIPKVITDLLDKLNTGEKPSRRNG
jgi:phage-related holin